MMKQLVFGFLVLLALSGDVFGGKLLGSTVTPITGYDDITFWWRCETEILGSSDYYGTGDSTPIINGEASLTVGAAKVGTYGIATLNKYDYYRFDVLNDDLLSDSSRLGYWLYLESGITTYQITSIVIDAVSYAVIHLSDGRLRFYNASVSITSTNAFPPDVWGFLEIALSPSENKVEFFIDGISIGSGVDVDFAGGSVTRMQFGTTDGNDAVIYIDNIMISNDNTREFYNDNLHSLTDSPKVQP